MKLSKVIIRNFKRFEKVVFEIPDGELVVAGPNNSGKTTLLQAIATWSVAFECWRNLNKINQGMGYTKAPMSRQSLHSVPLLSLSALWRNAAPQTWDTIEIILVIDGNELPMEITYDTTEQLFARPKATADWKKIITPNKKEKEEEKERLAAFARELTQNFVFIPSMSGISIEEPMFQKAKIRQLLGQSKPGEVLRNLLAEAHDNEAGWLKLCRDIKEIFGYELLPPNSQGANIIAGYKSGDVMLDIASAGAGFLQVILLFAFFVNRKNCVLLLDEPDAHLHILLQDNVYEKLQEFARKSNSSLIIATHSERIINMTDDRRLHFLFDSPRRIKEGQKPAVIAALATIKNTDKMLAQEAGGILYVEGHTDIAILKEWAQVLNHPLSKFLTRPFWKPAVLKAGGSGIQSDKHFDALKLAFPDIAGVDLRDSDGRDDVSYKLYKLQNGLQRFFWKRYEIESYLIYPDSISYFVKETTRQEQAKNNALQYMRNNFPPAVFENPLDDHEYLKNTKAKTILSRIFEAAGMHNFDNYSELAAAMPKKAIHPEVIEKLDAIAKAFGIMKP